MKGQFITFEGGEGSGKSTHVAKLAARLRTEGLDVVTTREPGGTAEAEAIRALLVSGEIGRWTAEAETLLNYAARDSHLVKFIRPALMAGICVISDRFMDSTRAYQGYAGDCDMGLIDNLERAIVGGTRPRLTLIFDLDPLEGLARAKARNDVEDRYERKGLAFHKRLREGFLDIARKEPQRCRVIDAGADIAEVENQVWLEVNKALAIG
jgi:dTMP kinase